MKKTLYLISELILCLSLCACSPDATNAEPFQNFTSEVNSEISSTEQQEKTPDIVGAWKLVSEDDFLNPEIIIFYEDNTYLLLHIYEAEVLAYEENNYEVIDEDKVVIHTYDKNLDEIGVTTDYKIKENTMVYNQSTYERIAAERYLGNTLIGTWQGYGGSVFRIPTEDRDSIPGHNITFYNDKTYKIVYYVETRWSDYSDITYGNYDIMNDGDVLYIAQDDSERIIDFEYLGYGLMLIEPPYNQGYWYSLLMYSE